MRVEGRFELVYPIGGYVSPRLGIRFEEEDGALRVFGPDGREFCTREQRVEEIQEELRKTALAFEDERERALNALDALAEERERAEQESARAEQERAAKDALAAKLRELGIDPATVLKPAG